MAEIGRLANLPDMLVKYRIHPGSTNWKKRDIQQRNKPLLIREAYQRRGKTMPENLQFSGESTQPAIDKYLAWVWVTLKHKNIYARPQACPCRAERRPLFYPDLACRVLRAEGVLMSAPPAVTVYMPAYNVGRYIRQAAQSVLAQTFGDFEFIIIDDGSKDDTLAVAMELAAADARIRLISRPNAGVSATANEAIALARGEFIARLDGDDVALPLRWRNRSRSSATTPVARRSDRACS